MLALTPDRWQGKKMAIARNRPRPDNATARNRPRPDAAVLGSSSAAPVDNATVLGGLGGVKQRLASDSIPAIAAALSDALKYEAKGLLLVIQALQESSMLRKSLQSEALKEPWWLVKRALLEILRYRTDPELIDALRKHLPFDSAADIDYKPLEDLLAKKLWQKADEETIAILLKIADRKELWLTKSDLKKLLYGDLATIDCLWLKHSGGRFGLSVQAQIWKTCNWQRQGHVYWQCRSFGDIVGWNTETYYASNKREYDFERCPEITDFNLSLPIGHLPSIFKLGGGYTYVEYDALTRYYYQCSEEPLFGFEMLDSFLRHFIAERYQSAWKTVYSIMPNIY